MGRYESLAGDDDTGYVPYGGRKAVGYRTGMIAMAKRREVNSDFI